MDEHLRLKELREDGSLSPRKPRPESIPPGYPTPDTDDPHGLPMLPPQSNAGYPRPGLETRGAPVVNEVPAPNAMGRAAHPHSSPRPEEVPAKPELEQNPGGASLRRVAPGDEPRYEQTQYQDAAYQGAQDRGPRPQGGPYQAAPVQDPSYSRANSAAAPARPSDQTPISRAVPGYPSVRLNGAPTVPVGLPRPAVR